MIITPWFEPQPGLSPGENNQLMLRSGELTVNYSQLISLKIVT
jgi:hypothetical protein